MNRRHFIKHSTGFCLGGLSLTALPSIHGKAHASGSYKIGLSMYSLRFHFQNGSLSVFDYPAFARKTFGLTEIDVWDGAFPKQRKTDPEYYRELKKHADKAGANLFLLMAGAVDAKGKTLAKRKEAIEPFKAYIDNATILGSTFVRIFLKAPDVDRGDAISHCIDALQPIAHYAKEKGIIIAIEPGASDWAKQGDFLADIAREMNDPHLRLMPDFGKMKDHDPYGGTEAMMPFTSVVSAKSHNFDENGNEVDFDYHRLIKTVIDANFKGIVAIEYEGKVTPPVEGVLATKQLLERFL